MINRRRFINIMAVSVAALGTSTARANNIQPVYWHGVALGADAQLQIIHPDKKHAAHLVELALAEVKRLEHIFSLYLDTSSINQLNQNGLIYNPPTDLQRLLSESQYYSKLTDGNFDPTVQPIWQLYQAELSAGNDLPPSHEKIANALDKVGYQGIAIDDKTIRFNQPGMAITLNGIAQGYITDRVTELLHANGLEHALIDMGEIRALGQKDKQQPWQVGIANPRQIDSFIEKVELSDQAMATSSGYGTSFDTQARFTHLFNPHSGIATPKWDSVTVKAKNATTADALSTAFSLMDQDQIQAIATKLAIDVWLVKNNQQEALHLS